MVMNFHNAGKCLCRNLEQKEVKLFHGNSHVGEVTEQSGETTFKGRAILRSY